MKYRKQINVKLYGLTEKISLPFDYDCLGALSQEALAQEMALADIHLSFSMTNISTVIYEAMACGCACVEADVELVKGMVTNKENCLLAKPDCDGVFSVLETLVINEKLRRSIAKKGYEFARRMTEAEMCGAFEKCLSESWLI